MNNLKMERLKTKNIDWGKVILLLLILIVCVVASLISARFASVDNIINIFRQTSAVGILAVGMTFVILTGGIDLSAGYGVTLGAIVVGLVFKGTENAIAGILCGIIVCMALGLLNGFLVTKVKIMPFIVTLATMSITQGVLNLIAMGAKLRLEAPVFEAIGNGKIVGIPVSCIIMGIVFVVGALILKTTTAGGYIYAIGSNEKNTKLAGVNTDVYKIFAYLVSGICMGLAAIVMGSRIVQVTQESGGNTMLMDCIAATIIGGTSVEGGKGDMLGTFLGVIFMGIISSMLVFLSIPAIAQDLFKGLIIIMALFLNRLSKNIKEKPIKVTR
ncbi:MAG: ABC transporter permease [Christensenella sp.]|nr:ABC transporter permease [Christensenella sp.]